MSTYVTGHLLAGLPVTTPVQTACDLLQKGRQSAHIEAVLSGVHRRRPLRSRQRWRDPCELAVHRQSRRSGHGADLLDKRKTEVAARDPSDGGPEA